MDCKDVIGYKNRASFGTWLHRIAYNVFYDYIRSRKETCTMDDVTDEAAWGASRIRRLT
ncbi:MAG: hypothetical protein J6V12_08165 [Bacteroidaceae bacterium]|nr:hypothetical protein [Bacteroidaceae bacterium]